MPTRQTSSVPRSWAYEVCKTCQNEPGSEKHGFACHFTSLQGLDHNHMTFVWPCRSLDCWYIICHFHRRQSKPRAKNETKVYPPWGDIWSTTLPREESEPLGEGIRSLRSILSPLADIFGRRDSRRGMS
jgi:hypothetical protein